MRANFSRQYAIVTVGMMIVIGYGSLYPFDFSLPASGPGPVQALLRTWANRPGRGDFLSNILLYAPLGFFGALTFSRRAGFISRFVGAVLTGFLLSVAMELAQYYDVGRDTEASDVYANVLGAALGAILGIIFGGSLRWPLIDQVAANRVPALLLLAWAAYRLYPFVPTIDLHKYWNTIKPIILAPQLPPYDLFRHTAIWLTIYALIARIAVPLRAWLLIPLFAGAVLFSKILIISASLSVAEVAGAIVAYLIWTAFRPLPRFYLAVTIVMFSLTIVAQRLEPFQFMVHPVSFGWIPFKSFMYGSIDVDVLSFLEKFFLYGGLIWLLMQAGFRPAVAAGAVAVMLFITSMAETYLPHRSAEITDAVMALAIAVIFALVAKGDEMADAQSSSRSSRISGIGTASLGHPATSISRKPGPERDRHA